MGALLWEYLLIISAVCNVLCNLKNVVMSIKIIFLSVFMRFSNNRTRIIGTVDSRAVCE